MGAGRACLLFFPVDSALLTSVSKATDRKKMLAPACGLWIGFLVPFLMVSVFLKYSVGQTGKDHARYCVQGGGPVW